MKNDLLIVLPSYNESENLYLLIKNIFKILPSVKIIVVDDSSSSENKNIRLIIGKRKNVLLISRNSKKGRGSAVLQGLKKSLEYKSIKYVIEMDTDLAHDPKEIERFLSKLKEDNYDLIIGSRYLHGAKIVNISKERTILSRFINKFLKIWLGVNISDFTSGFRLYSRKAVELLVSEKIISKGFITLSETLYKISNKRMKIGEVPITWNYRVYGKSNVSLKELFISLYFVIYFKFQYLLSKRVYRIILASLFVFLLAFTLRISTLNQMGTTWDEPEYITQGYKMDELLLKKDFGNSFFYTTYDHPPLVKYIYGITAHLDSKKVNGNVFFNYDYTYSRLLSSIVGSLSAVLIFLIGYELAGFFIGISSGVIFSTIPFFVGLTQLATTESWLMFFFTSSSYFFLKLLQKFSYKKAITLGILTGLALLIKQSNGLLFPLYFIFYVIYFLFSKNREKFVNKKIIVSISLIILLTVIVFVSLWPMPYAHLDVISKINQKIWLVKTAPPEVFWGKLILSPIIYYPTMFFVTTPFLLLIVSFLGLKFIDKKRNWIFYCLIIWFLFPFIQSFYPWRQHGIRYIIEIYAPFSIICAFGLKYFAECFKSNQIRVKLITLLAIFIYLLFSLLSVTPYYLDYYNELVGGTKGVYDHGYFHLGWWGEGMRDAGIYLKNHAKNNSTVGLAVSPIQSFPPINNLKLQEYNTKKSYDYIVVNYFHVLREGFNDTPIKNNYKLIYETKAGEAPIVFVYSK